MKNNELQPFEGKEIRKIWHNEQWYFSVVDVIEVLTDSPKPKTYWAMMKKREAQPFTFCEPLKLKASDGRNRLTDCANTEGVLRIVMSVPSPKAEPLKLWLAEQGKRAIEEANDPELLTERQAELYKAKGYPDEWIKRRVQSIETRKELTDEWKKRGITDDREYSILTAVIAKGTFGMTPTEHAKFKDIGNKNLRDHMTRFELIFAALGEETTRHNTEQAAKDGYYENYEIAVESGRMTGDALKGFEQRTGIKVVSSDNFLHLKKGEEAKELPQSDETDKTK
ncbi:MAG: Bro-N domain-containing protein [Saprospiraceae bacterium]|nr:Bro-N domain-containing protein [Saprospiraceae bacterium]